MVLGHRRYDASDGKQVMVGWGSNASGVPTFQGKGVYPMASAHEQLSLVKGTLGQAKGAHVVSGPPGRSYPTPRLDIRPDIPREVIQLHGMAGMHAKDAHSRQSVALMVFDEGMLGHDSEWHRLNMAKPRSGVKSNALSSRGNQERLGGPKIRKHCFFFNTPRGCRNGIHCNFLHEVAPEKIPSDKVHHDADQKAPQPDKGDTFDAEAK